MKIFIIIIINILFMNINVANSQNKDTALILKKGEELLLLKEKKIIKIIEKQKKINNKLIKQQQIFLLKCSTKCKDPSITHKLDNINGNIKYSIFNYYDSLKIKHINNSFLKSIDSIKNISYYISDSLSNKVEYINIDSLKNEYLIQEYITYQIKSNNSKLRSILKNTSLIKKFSTYNKQFNYKYAQFEYWKQYTNKNNLTEEKILDIFLTIPGIEKIYNSNTGFENIQDLSTLNMKGYQTKELVNSHLEQNTLLSPQEIFNQLNSKLKTINIKNDFNSLAQKKQEIAGTQKNIFENLNSKFINKSKNDKINTLRELPFYKRFDYEYNTQYNKLDKSINEIKVINVGLNCYYKINNNKSFGLGIDALIGLGWENINLSFEGIAFRGFINQDLIWDVSLEGIYEQYFYIKNSNLAILFSENNIIEKPNSKTILNYMNIIALKKTYSLNKKQKASFLLGYNINSKSKLNSKWVFRINYKL